MEDYLLFSNEGKERYAELLREAEDSRRVLRSARISELPRFLESLLLFLISIT
jgi:hypothetical protein